MDSLINFTSKFKNTPPESIKTFLSLASKKTYKKHEIITKTGEIAKDFYIIKSGVIRSFYTDEKGKQYIRTLFTTNKTTGSLGSLLSKKPSNLNFEELKKITEIDISIANLYSTILEYLFLLMESRIFDLSVLNATERYLKLREEIPKIENIIPQYHIASYLNVSAVQLSRIRKKLYKN
jgi:CRP-like cAMP-binding protein